MLHRCGMLNPNAEVNSSAAAPVIVLRHVRNGTSSLPAASNAGTGQVAKHLLCSADHIEATDVSAAMIAQAKRGNFSSKLYFSVQDMFHLPYADQSFDVVIVSNALHIVPHPEKALIEFRRVLKNDGTLIAPTFTHAENSPWGNLQALALKIAGFPLHSRWTSAAYLAFLQQNGWTVCKSVVLQNSIPLTYAECKKVERR